MSNLELIIWLTVIVGAALVLMYFGIRSQGDPPDEPIEHGDGEP